MMKKLFFRIIFENSRQTLRAYLVLFFKNVIENAILMFFANFSYSLNLVVYVFFVFFRTKKKNQTCSLCFFFVFKNQKQFLKT